MQDVANWEVIADRFNAECRARKASAASRKSGDRVAHAHSRKSRSETEGAKRFFTVRFSSLMRTPCKKAVFPYALTGSPKQIAWAEEIREKLLGLLADPLAGMADRDLRISWFFEPAWSWRELSGKLPQDAKFFEQIGIACDIGRKDRLRNPHIAERRDELALRIEDAEVRQAFLDIAASPAFLTSSETTRKLDLKHVRPLVFARRVKAMLEAETSAVRVIDCREGVVEMIYAALRRS